MKISQSTLVILAVSLFISGCTSILPTANESQTEVPPAIVWRTNMRDGYEPTPPDAVVPDCGDLVLQLPLRDLSMVEGRLAPGQFRGGDYKPHGAFRVRMADVEVLSAISGYVTAVSAYLQTADGEIGKGEVQYLVDIQHPCGIQVRYDHLKELSAPLQQVFADNGVTVQNDSRTTDIQPPVAIQAGDVLATRVGLTETSTNYFFDFGVYDFRERQPSKRSFQEYMDLLPGGLWLGVYGTCFYDRFSPENAAAIRAIPLGSMERGSDYCADDATAAEVVDVTPQVTQTTPLMPTATNQSDTPATSNTQAVIVTWMWNGIDKYDPTPPGVVVPECVDVGWQAPLRDFALVEGRLEPGQIRGGNYKAHGGFRMKQSEVDVLSAINGAITSVAAYRENATDAPESGEVQYLIDIQHPCGMQVRYDHLKVLSAPMQQLFADNGVRVGADSRTTFIRPPMPIQAGDVIATAIGMTETVANYSFDFGAYDLRAPQPSKRSTEELLAMGPDGVLGQFGMCWYDLFGPEQARAIRAIPLGGLERGSDYCE